MGGVRHPEHHGGCLVNEGRDLSVPCGDAPLLQEGILEYHRGGDVH